VLRTRFPLGSPPDPSGRPSGAGVCSVEDERQSGSHYGDTVSTRSLTGLVALRLSCHEAKHAAHANANVTRASNARRRRAVANPRSIDQIDAHVAAELAIRTRQSAAPRSLDLTSLKTIHVPVPMQPDPEWPHSSAAAPSGKARQLRAYVGEPGHHLSGVTRTIEPRRAPQSLINYRDTFAPAAARTGNRAPHT